jgi:hypothetical protein
VKTVIIDLSTIHGGQPRLDKLNSYIRQILKLAGSGNTVILTGDAPIWMYLIIAHALNDKAAVLKYVSPETGEITVFNHYIVYFLRHGNANL